MGDLATDTAVELRPGGDSATSRFAACLSGDWEIWGPNGGYVASVALRAAGAHSRFGRPAGIAVHYLGVGRFEAVEVAVTTLRAARRAESMRVSVAQGEVPILEALVWAVDDLAGLEHTTSRRPSPAPPDGLPTPAERLAASGRDPEPGFPFWSNFDHRPLDWVDDWEHRPPAEPETQGWYRFVPTATFADPWVDACRSLVLADTLIWPAAARAHTGDLAYYAPSIDLSCSFHQVAIDAVWLYTRAEAPIGRDGLIGGRSEVWTADGRLVASASGQLLCRPSR